jgi:hypothetical protein
MLGRKEAASTIPSMSCRAGINRGARRAVAPCGQWRIRPYLNTQVIPLESTEGKAFGEVVWNELVLLIRLQAGSSLGVNARISCGQFPPLQKSQRKPRPCLPAGASVKSNSSYTIWPSSLPQAIHQPNRASKHSNRRPTLTISRLYRGHVETPILGMHQAMAARTIAPRQRGQGERLTYALLGPGTGTQPPAEPVITGQNGLWTPQPARPTSSATRSDVRVLSFPLRTKIPAFSAA